MVVNEWKNIWGSFFAEVKSLPWSCDGTCLRATPFCLFSCGTFCSVPSVPLRFCSFCPLSLSFVLAHGDQVFWSLFVSLFSSSWLFEFVPFIVFPHPFFCSPPLILYRPPLPLHCTAPTTRMSRFHICILIMTLLLPLPIHHYLSPASPLPARLPPEIITTNLVKISLYLNSWISEARSCWQSLFNNSQVKQWSRK